MDIKLLLKLDSISKLKLLMNIARRRFATRFRQQQSRWNSNQVKIFSPALFTSVFVGCTIGTCFYIRHKTIWQEHLESLDTKKQLDRIYKRIFRPVGDEPLLRHSSSVFVNIRDIFQLKFKNATSAEIVTWSLIGVNIAVFAAWRLPMLQGFMNRHFVHIPATGRSYTMLTSTFSHSSGMHLAFNMMALNGFLPTFQQSSGFSTEQTLAFYLSAGAVSAFGSHLYSALAPGRAVIGSLGASGAIWALLAGYTQIDSDQHTFARILTSGLSLFQA